MVKAVREAMVHTRWTVPNLEHEKALVDFIEAILEDTQSNIFLHDLKQFAEKIAYHGALNSLSQLVIKLAAPGVADFYQGSELWDLRLVDPDNRQPVAFDNLASLLAAQNDQDISLADLLLGWRTGQIKMQVMQRGLRFRKENSPLLLKGSYIPLEVKGTYRKCVIAYGRRYRGDWVLVIAPRFTLELGGQESGALRVRGWKDTRLLLPRDAPSHWVSVLSSRQFDVDQNGEMTGEIALEQALQDFPVAMLSNQPQNSYF
jgi:(1->4)-alpha-D-glucan 1-alpha-D-glucosylmutase